MIVKEYRVVLPLTVDEYQIGQLYSFSEASKNETGGGEGVEVVKNEPFTSEPGLLGGKYCTGQYTYKIYHFKSKVPPFVRLVAPKGSLEFHEEAWNAYPYCKTIITNPQYMKQDFVICIETLHCPDTGNQENVHELTQKILKQREVVKIDIANDSVSSNDYKENEDPSKFVSRKANRGPLDNNWIVKAKPVMCAYKLVTVEFKWFGLQGRVENYIHKVYKRMFASFHRQVFCWIDRWYDLTMDDIRALEDKTKEELDKQRSSGAVRGTKPDED